MSDTTEVVKQKASHLWSILTRTELWVAVATIAGVIMKSDLLDGDGAIYKTIAFVASILGALGYGALRTIRKNTKDKINADGVIAALGANTSDPT